MYTIYRHTFFPPKNSNPHMIMKRTLFATSALTLALGSTYAASVFSDTFGYAGGGSGPTSTMVTTGGWTTHNGASLAANGAGILNGDGSDLNNWAEYNHTTSLSAGDILTIDGNVDRGTGGGYGYITRIYLWDGINAGTRTEVAGSVQFPTGGIDNGPHALNQVSYTVSSADITAGRDQVIFRYGHQTGWGETHDVDFGVTPVPEPSSLTLLGLGGLALLLRRRQ